MRDNLKMPMGKHKGRGVWDVMLRNPDFIAWLKEHHWDGFQWLYEGIAELVAEFDEAPFSEVSCAGDVDGCPCTNPVTRFSIYQKTSVPVFWCEDCDPCQLGAGKAKLSVGRTYYGALNHVIDNGGGMVAKRKVIREIAVAKGFLKTRG